MVLRTKAWSSTTRTVDTRSWYRMAWVGGIRRRTYVCKIEYRSQTDGRWPKVGGYCPFAGLQSAWLTDKKRTVSNADCAKKTGSSFESDSPLLPRVFYELPLRRGASRNRFAHSAVPVTPHNLPASYDQVRNPSPVVGRTDHLLAAGLFNCVRARARGQVILSAASSLGSLAGKSIRRLRNAACRAACSSRSIAAESQSSCGDGSLSRIYLLAAARRLALHKGIEHHVLPRIF